MKATWSHQEQKNERSCFSRVSTMIRRLCLSEVHKAVQTYAIDPRSPPFGDLGRLTFENFGNSTK